MPGVVFLPAVSDENPYLRQLARHLADLGVEVARPHDGVVFLPAVLRARSARIVHFHWLHPFFFSPSPLKAISKFLIFLFEVLVLRLAGRKLVWTVHNLRDHEGRYPGLDRGASWFVAGLADALIVHCQAAREEVLAAMPGLDGRKIFVVPHGHYMGSYPNETGRAAARRELGVPRRSLVFLFLGRVRPYKGVLELIGAFRRLGSESGVEPEMGPVPGPEWADQDPCLVIAGNAFDDSFEAVVSRAIADSAAIRYHRGFVSAERVQSYMNACDVVVFPYRHVLTSGAVLLAMSFGRACIAPRAGCIGEVLDEEGVFFFEIGEPKGLDRALVEAARRRDDLERMGRHNRSRVEQYGWERVAELTREVYVGTLDGGRRVRGSKA